MATTRRPADLPDFERPPLNELVLSVQFASVPFQNFHSGLLWQRFANEYPRVEEQPPIEPVFETFGALQAREHRLTLQLMPMPATMRYWFVSPDGDELLQVQSDRLIHNWRRQQGAGRYPRYEPLREKFAGEIAKAAEFFREQGWGQIAFNQCEVSYVNVISFEDGTDPNSRLTNIFTIIFNNYSDEGPGDIERGQFKLSYVISDESGKEPVGRLHVDAMPVVLSPDNRPAVRLTLTARGRPKGESTASALAWLNVGREAIVRGFTSITTSEMHRLWGRTQ